MLLPLAVVPVLVGPLQALLAVLSGALLLLAGAVGSLLRPRTALRLLRLLWSQKYVVAAAVAVVLILRFAVPALRHGKSGTASPGGTDHAMFRGGPERRGWLPDSPDPMSGDAVWRFAGPAKTFFSSPAVDGRYVFAASAEKGLYSEKGFIFCLDASSGTVVWEAPLKGLRATFSSPAVAGRYVVCGEGLHDTTDARIVCLDRATGKVRWQFRTQSHVESSPCIDGDKVYVGAGDDGYYCLALEPDAAGNARKIWHLEGTNYLDAESSPVVWQNRVYLGLGVGGHAVCCVDARTGAGIWRVNTPYPVVAGVTIAGNKLYAPMGNGNYIETAEQAWNKMLAELKKNGASSNDIARLEKENAPGGAIWCLDAATGEKLWEHKLPSAVIGSVAATADRLYFGSLDGDLHCLSAAGEPLAKWNVGAAILASPALARDHVYAVTRSGALFCLDAAAMTPVWDVRLSAKEPAASERFISSPTIAAGHIYVGTAVDGLACVGQPGKREPGAWSGFQGGPARTGWADRTPVPSRLTRAWVYPATTGEEFEVTGPLALQEHALYAPARSAAGNGLLKLNLNADGAAPTNAAWFRELALPVCGSVAVVADCVYAVEGGRGETNRRLHALRKSDGSDDWTAPVADGADGGFTIAGHRLLLASLNDGLTCLDLAGHVLWTRDTGRCLGAPEGIEGLVVLVTSEPARVAVLDAIDGAELWSRPLALPPGTSPLVTADAVCVGAADGVLAFRLTDGSLLWTQPDAGDVAVPLIKAGGAVACVNRNLDLVLLDGQNGSVIKRYSGLDGPFAPLVTDNSLFVARAARMVRTSLGPERTSETCLTLGKEYRLATPFVAADQRVYAGTSKGILCAQPARSQP